MLELRMISMIFYSWSRSAALPTYNDILSLCPILMIHSHFSSRVHPDNEENDPGGGFQQQNLRATQSTQVLLEWQFKTQALNSERDLYLARPTFLSIAKCPGKCLLSHNQHLCQHFNRGQDFKLQWHNRILQDCLADSCLKCIALHEIEIQSFPEIITKSSIVTPVWLQVTVNQVIQFVNKQICPCHNILSQNTSRLDPGH